MQLMRDEGAKEGTVVTYKMSRTGFHDMLEAGCRGRMAATECFKLGRDKLAVMADGSAKASIESDLHGGGLCKGQESSLHIRSTKEQLPC